MGCGVERCSHQELNSCPRSLNISQAPFVSFYLTLSQNCSFGAECQCRSRGVSQGGRESYRSGLWSSRYVENVKISNSSLHTGVDSGRPFFQKRGNQALRSQHVVPILSPSGNNTNQPPSISALSNKSAQSLAVRRSGFKPEQASLPLRSSALPSASKEHYPSKRLL